MLAISAFSRAHRRGRQRRATIACFPHLDAPATPERILFAVEELQARLEAAE